MRVVFMGSPEFAVASLRAVAARHEVVLVVSQPDKPAGRGGALTSPAVAQAARALGLPLAQPPSVRKPDFAEVVRPLGAEVAVVVAYGKILPPSLLAAFPRGCINVHGSALPAYRGAAPIQRAIIDGLTTTAVSLMQLDPGMDTGPVFAQRPVAIGPWETAGDLMTRMADDGAALLIDVLDGIVAGTAQATPQPTEGVSHAAMLEKRDGLIDFTQTAQAVAARMRGVDPWPGAQAALRGQPIKLFAVNAIGPGDAAVAAGTVSAIDADGVWVQCGAQAVRIGAVQAAGKKRMPAAAFAAGRGLAVGDVLTGVTP